MANINKVALLNNGKVVGAGRNKDNSNLAPIEATTTASRSYLVGDYLMLQGEFYKVISAIAIGDTLTVGTNIQSTSVGDEIDEVNDNTVKPINYDNGRDILTSTTSYPFTYTATGNGWLNVQRLIKNATPGSALTINNIVMISLSANAEVCYCVPIRKNDVIVFSAVDTSTRAKVFYD